MSKKFSMLTGILILSVVALAGCDQPGQPPTPDTEQAGAAEAGAEQSPQDALAEFFDALQRGDVRRALDHVARDLPRGDQEEVEVELLEFSRSLDSRRPPAILDSYRDGDLAIVAVRFSPARGPQKAPIRPILMVLEESNWRVDWRLVGVHPDHAVRMSPPARPLYEWYAERADELEQELAGGGTEAG